MQLLLLMIQLSWSFASPDVRSIYTCKNGKVYLKSDAPLELIEASSNQLKAVIDLDNRTFAFTVSTISFQGFNSPLQKEHFNENYLESVRYPQSTFIGKIIEDTDMSKDGQYIIRAKGKLNLHGVEQERIIKSGLEVKGKKIIVHSEFTVLLDEHNITIPKIVHQKIAEEIMVVIDAEFLPQ